MLSSLSALSAVAPAGTLARGAGAAAFLLYDASTWSWWHYVAWTGVLVVALEGIAQLALVIGRVACFGRSIERKPGHLDALEPVDVGYIAFGKVGVGVLTYHILRYCWYADGVLWALSDLSLATALLPVPLLFVAYDFFYSPFHRALHIRAVYGLVHKHHHRQHAPSRGNTDAINVHPFELVGGEYLHLLAIYLVATFAMRVHVAAVLTFVLAGGFAASLNHTRFDVRFPFFESVYQVRYHDLHHWNVNYNFGQYTMLWDRVWGWYTPYPDKVVSKKKK